MVELSYTPWPGIDKWSEEGRIEIDSVHLYHLILDGYGKTWPIYGYDPAEGFGEVTEFDALNKYVGLQSVRLRRLVQPYDYIPLKNVLRLTWSFDYYVDMNDYVGLHLWHRLLGHGIAEACHPTGNCIYRLLSRKGYPPENRVFPTLNFGTPEGLWEEKLWTIESFDFHGENPLDMLAEVGGVEIECELQDQRVTPLFDNVSMWIDNFFLWRPMIFNPILSVRAIDSDDGKPVAATVTLTSPAGLSNTYNTPFVMRVSPGVWTITLNDVNGVFIKWSDEETQRTKIVDVQKDTYLTGIYQRTGNGNGVGVNPLLIALGLAAATTAGAVIILYPEKVKKLLGW